VVRFERRTSLPVDPEQAFDLSLSVDAHLDSFARTREQAVAGVTSGVIGRGEFVTWRARHFGITWTMTSAITAWERPHRFVDEQQHGPFKSFWHEHTFHPRGDGTELHDVVVFRAPLGVLGRIAERIALRRHLSHLIDIRNEFLVEQARKLAAGTAPPPATPIPPTAAVDG
jgi:ligand-binding SRPBCC domain-containing protein